MDEPFNINDLKLFPLYHGTDLSITKIDKKDRESLKIGCMEMAEYLWQIFKPYYYKDKYLSDFMRPLGADKDETEWQNLRDKLNLMDQMHEGNEQYQYDSFHLTTEISTAYNYARRSFAFGEIGLCVYRMYKAARVLGLKELTPDKDMEFKLDMLVNYAESNGHQPVIFAINNLDLNLIEVENCGSIKKAVERYGYDLNSQPLVIHYKGEVVLNPTDAILL